MFGGLMVAASLFLFWKSYGIAGFSALSSPGAFPMAASAVMVLASSVALVRTFELPAPAGEGGF
ncbi:MAG TPA: tripartite tricarboxylate transporter TctB family protein, partial [Paracoccaceae bacterium]|nr:tripartite tricarboxylate transporter TctB family protein [Paracoccaceae bacterium]